MRYRVVVTSCHDANVLVTARCTNVALAELEESTVCSIHPTREQHMEIQPHWTHLLIDEVCLLLIPGFSPCLTKFQAAQASEPEVLIPVSVVHIPASQRSQYMPQLVLCGDPHQRMSHSRFHPQRNLHFLVPTVGPLITAPTALANELNVSLLERLFERPVYRNHPFARTRSGPPPPGIFTKPRMTEANFVPFANLVKASQILWPLSLAYPCPELSESSCYSHAPFRYLLSRLP
jgi:hypothetical protein